MFVRFIAQAGIAIEEGGITILVDPWFSDSTIDNPIVESISGGKTIDFQIPKTEEVPLDYKPQAILLSHFHAHHAPVRDINTIVAQGHTVVVAFPDGKKSGEITEKLFFYKNVTSLSVKNGETLRLGTLKITGMLHTRLEHIAWLVESPSGKVLHIADTRINKDFSSQIQDEIWSMFIDLKPDLVFINGARNSLRVSAHNVEDRTINESSGLSPIQTAKLLKLIKPKTASLIGMYNHSIWKDRSEFIPSSAHTEEEFRWALDWVAPYVKFVRVSPGHTFGIGDTSLGMKVDTYIA